MTRLTGFVGSFLAGVVVARLFDPDRGRRRRALLRDKVVRAGRTLGDAVETTTRDISNRAEGLKAELRSPFDLIRPRPGPGSSSCSSTGRRRRACSPGRPEPSSAPGHGRARGSPVS
jgi:hypothetical protein